MEGCETTKKMESKTRKKKEENFGNFLWRIFDEQISYNERVDAMENIMTYVNSENDYSRLIEAIDSCPEIFNNARVIENDYLKIINAMMEYPEIFNINALEMCTRKLTEIKNKKFANTTNGLHLSTFVQDYWEIFECLGEIKNFKDSIQAKAMKDIVIYANSKSDYSLIIKAIEEYPEILNDTRITTNDCIQIHKSMLKYGYTGTALINLVNKIYKEKGWKN